jgi:membrane associated rhomboid family serine protease
MLRRPSVRLLTLFFLVYGLQRLLGLSLGEATVQGLFSLSRPVFAAPWTLFTSVLAHASLAHLLSNAVIFLPLAFLLERQTSNRRFYAFFFTTGALAGLAELWTAAIAGTVLPGIPTQVSVIGASGAIFAMLGYLLTSNRLSQRLVSWLPLSGRAQLALFGILAAAVTVVTAGQGVALIAHFTGLLMGLLAGRARLL